MRRSDFPAVPRHIAVVRPDGSVRCRGIVLWRSWLAIVCFTRYMACYMARVATLGGTNAATARLSRTRG